MTDRAQIFTELTKRNALRREAGLPLLNLREELEYQVTLDLWRAWVAVCEAHDGLRNEIRERILAEYLAEGRTMQSAGGRWLVETRTEAEFFSELARRGHVRPKTPSRHPVTYGGGV